MKTSFRFLPILFLFSCQHTDNKETSPRKTDLNRDNLKGSIEQIKQGCFKADEKFGEIVQGEKWGFDDDNFHTIYNERGNQIEKSTYNHDGSLFSKFNYIYDNNANLIEENRFNSDGSLNYKEKFKYFKYFKNNKLREGKIYSPDGSLYSMDTTELDEIGNELKYHNYDKNNKINSLSTSRYNKMGNIIEKDYVDRGTHINDVYKYDSTGNIIEDNSFFHSSDMTKLADTTRYVRTIKYDMNNNVIETLDVNPASKGKPSKESFSYVYDKQNNWIKRICFKNDKPYTISIRQIKYM